MADTNHYRLFSCHILLQLLHSNRSPCTRCIHIIVPYGEIMHSNSRLVFKYQVVTMYRLLVSTIHCSKHSIYSIGTISPFTSLIARILRLPEAGGNEAIRASIGFGREASSRLAQEGRLVEGVALDSLVELVENLLADAGPFAAQPLLLD